MKFIKELFDKKEISILILILPYFGFNYETIVHSPFFSYTQLISIFACLLFIDVFIKWILSKLNGKSKTIISLIVIFTTLVFFLWAVYYKLHAKANARLFWSSNQRENNYSGSGLIVCYYFILTKKKKNKLSILKCIYANILCISNSYIYC